MEAVILFSLLIVTIGLSIPIGITLGLNWINALVIGVTGFPGLVLLLLIKYLF